MPEQRQTGSKGSVSLGGREREEKGQGGALGRVSLERERRTKKGAVGGVVREVGKTWLGLSGARIMGTHFRKSCQQVRLAEPGVRCQGVATEGWLALVGSWGRVRSQEQGRWG